MIEGSKGTMLQTTAEMGLIVVAIKEYEIGDLVIVERPTLVWERDTMSLFYFLNLARSFSELTSDRKVLIMGMYHPKLFNNHEIDTSKALRDFLKEANLPFPPGANFTKSFDLKTFDAIDMPSLISIVSTNAHTFQDKFSALFDYGSKVQHSCDPNCSYSSTTGSLVYTAIKKILIGDNISFTYVDVLETTDIRREILLRDKHFYCMCDRCVDVDYWRGFTCVGGCGGRSYPQCVSQNSLRTNSENCQPMSSKVVMTCVQCDLSDKQLAIKCQDFLDNEILLDDIITSYSISFRDRITYSAWL